MSLRTATAGTLLACLALTHAQLQHWRNSETVFRQALAATQENPVAHNALGAALAAMGRSDEAIAEFQDTLRIMPEHVRARSNLAFEYLRRGEQERAAAELRAVLRLRPDDFWARHHLAQVLAQRGNYEEATLQFAVALKQKPDDAAAHANLGWALAEQGKAAEAIRHMETAVRLWPDWPEGWARYARVLLVSPDPALRDGPRAVQLATRACELTRYTNPNYLGILAAALAEADRFEEAAQRTRQALDLARQRGQAQMVTQLELRLKSYREAKRPGEVKL